MTLLSKIRCTRGDSWRKLLTPLPKNSNFLLSNNRNLYILFTRSHPKLISNPCSSYATRRFLSTAQKYFCRGGQKGGGNNNDGPDPKSLLMVMIALAFSVYMNVTLLRNQNGNSLDSSNNDAQQGQARGQGQPNDLSQLLNNPEFERGKVSWNEFVQNLLVKGEVQSIRVGVSAKQAEIKLHNGAVVRGQKRLGPFYMQLSDVESFEPKVREIEKRLGISASDAIPFSYDHPPSSSALNFASSLLILAFGYGVYRVISKSGPPNMSTMMRMMGMNNKFTVVDPRKPGSGRGVKLSDVAGAKEAKTEVMEFVDFLKKPSKYKELGAKMPKGALLLGPPGCGKTMLAKAVATEGLVPFISMNGSEFIEMIGGLGASRVRELFKTAAQKSPCIIYIDEIDAIGRARGGGMSSGGSGESEQTLNQLLVEMDGMGSQAGVIVLASTNRLDMLDKALLRPGRFDRHIMMDLPTQEERMEILESHLKGIVLEHGPSYYSKRLSMLTLGFSGADLANVVNEAALYAARNLSTKVSGKDLEYAIEKVICGSEKKESTVKPEERRIIAYHEAGHALVGWMLEHTDHLLKVTIVPRTSHALGFAQYNPTERKLYTQEQLSQRMCMALGGRVAESLTFNRVTTGAQNDLQKVMQLADAQVTQFGFSPVVGQLSFPQRENADEKRFFSNRTQAKIDREVNRLIMDAYFQTEKLLTQNRDKLAKMAEALLKKETLVYEEVLELWGPPPFPNKALIEPVQFESEINSWQNMADNQDPSNSA